MDIQFGGEVRRAFNREEIVGTRNVSGKGEGQKVLG